VADLRRPGEADVTSLVVFTKVAGFSLGSRGLLNWVLLLNTLWATTLVAVGAAALNQYVERNMDAVMRRTARRPRPAKLQPLEVLAFGVVPSSPETYGLRSV
jgi:heme o synthase